MAGNPARVWQGTGRIVISRVAVDGTRNACSKLYGALCRAAQALGYREAWTYTLPEEPGTSLRAAGFELVGVSAGGEHDRAKRPRRKSVRPDPKQRWRRVLVAATAAIALAACRHCPEATCPTLPAREPAPEPVVVVQPRPPCLLPDRPEPVALEMRASGDDVLLPRVAAVQLLSYLTAMRARDEAATACLEQP